MQRTSRRIAASMAAAIALALGAATLHAQPAGAPMGPGPGGPGAFGEHFMPRMIEEVKAKLNLDTQQQVMFDNAAAQGKAARESGRALHQKVKDAMRAELAKADPNLVAVATIADDVEQQGRALRQKVRDAWLQLYATFSVEQKAVVRDMLQKKMDRAEAFGMKMRERMLRHGG